jgi:hypothetical protein
MTHVCTPRNRRGCAFEDEEDRELANHYLERDDRDLTIQGVESVHI